MLKLGVAILLAGSMCIAGNAQEFKRITTISDPQADLSDSVFFIDNRTLGVYRDNFLAQYDIESGRLIKSGFFSAGRLPSVWDPRYSRPMLYYWPEKRVLYKCETLHGDQDVFVPYSIDTYTREPSLQYLLIEWERPPEMGYDSLETRSWGEYQLIEDNRKYYIKKNGSEPMEIPDVKAVYINTQLKSLNKLNAHFSGAGVARLLLGDTLLIVDDTEMKALVENQWFFSKYIINNKYNANNEYINLFGSYDSYSNGKLQGEENWDYFRYGMEFFLKYQPDAWPRKLVAVNLESLATKVVNLPYFHLFSRYPYDVNQKGTMLALGEYDIETRRFKHWAVYRIYYEGLVAVQGLRMRESPGISGKIMKNLQKGEKVKIIDVSDLEETVAGVTGSWMKVVTEDGRSGWVFGPYINVINFESTIEVAPQK